MRPIALGILAAVFVASQVSYVSAAPKHRNQTKEAENSDCVVTGWTEWSNTKPIFKCPDQNDAPKARSKQ